MWTFGCDFQNYFGLRLESEILKNACKPWFPKSGNLEKMMLMWLILRNYPEKSNNTFKNLKAIFETIYFVYTNTFLENFKICTKMHLVHLKNYDSARF